MATPARFRVMALPALALCCMAAPPALAQEQGNTRMFVEFGHMSVPDEVDGFTMAGLRVCSVAPLQPTVDWSLSVALLPAIVGPMDLDLAVPIRVGDAVQLVPRAGASALIVYGDEVAGGLLGWNYGGGVVLNPRGPLLLRADFTSRQLFAGSEGSTATLQSVSLGLGWRF